MSNAEPTLPAGAIGVDDDGEPVYPQAPPSPEELQSNRSVAMVEPTTSTLTISTEMSKATQYAAEKKAIASHLKVALPDKCIVVGDDGYPTVSPTFLHAVEGIAHQLLNLNELVVATQHGLAVSADEAGVIRVMNLFPGSSTVAAAAVPQGAFAAPAAVPAMAAPAAPVAPQPAAAPAAAQAPAPGFPAAPAPVAPGGFPPPQAAAVPPPAGQAQGTPTSNPNAWSNQTPEAKAGIIATIEAWVQSGGTNGTVQNRMVGTERYPGVTVGAVKVGGKTLLNNSQMGPATRAWAQSCVNGGLNLG